MRLLPVGHDHGGLGVARREAARHRRRHRRGDHQHLPLRHVRARSAGPSTASPRDRGRRVMGKWTRRAFIGTGTLVGGGFVLGVAGAVFAPSRHSVRSDDADGDRRAEHLDPVTPDNIVTVLVPHCEMGQGTQTALAMMAAEEMDADWNLVRVKEAPALDAYANALHRPRVHRRCSRTARARLRLRHLPAGAMAGLQITGGSMSVRTHRALRHARRRRRREGDADGAAAASVSACRASECTVAELARHAQGVGPIGHIRRAGEAAAGAVGAVAAGAERSRHLHDAPHVARRASTSRRRSTAARYTASTSRCPACSTPPSRSRRCSAASWCRWTPAPPRRCPA